MAGPCGGTVGLWGSVNTGMSAFREVEFTSSHTCKEVEDVNLWGTVRVIKVFLPHIHSHKGPEGIGMAAGREKLHNATGKTIASSRLYRQESACNRST
nr:D-beta-hydroxybutyrate dehydrogenase, mitochondrial-like [Pelodiscus sinensis]|eukprot:XP_025043889.1 D-beta-hydroxybutyrate dehydrogenase, mitochondrial-like [Pelodiscus sinensis]